MNKEMAEFIYEQMAGEQSGHMAMIPNNPMMFSLLKACGVCDKRDFGQFLFEVSGFFGKNHAQSIQDATIRSAASNIREYIESREDKTIGPEMAESVVLGTVRAY
jgi:hypothetical protein